MNKKEYISPEITIIVTDYAFNLLDLSIDVNDESGDDIYSSKGASVWDTEESDGFGW